MKFYLDTSALAKRYHDEEGSDFVNQIFSNHQNEVWISDISIIEIRSALARLLRENRINNLTYRNALSAIGSSVKTSEIHVVSFDQQAKSIAVGLVDKYGILESLRTLDAIQVAIAIRLKATSDVDDIKVVSSDSRFISVASKEGLVVLNPLQGGIENG